MLSKDQIEDLLEYCYVTPTIWRGDNMQVCCPVHGESNPSMGVSAAMGVCHCFSCGFSGGFEKLLYYSLPDEFGFREGSKKSEYRAFRKAREFLSVRYGLEEKDISGKASVIPRYEDFQSMEDRDKDNNVSSALFYAYKCGVSTYKYFFRRGFTKEDMWWFKIGYDAVSKTVVIPVFDPYLQVVGFIGRYIDKNRKKNERYKVYSFNRGDYLFPLDKVDTSKEYVILVEGIFDAMRLHSYGYRNTLAIMSDIITKKQLSYLRSICDCVLYLGDNDKMGIKASLENTSLLQKEGIKVFRVNEYPSYGKDVCDWSKEDTVSLIERSIHGGYKIPRMD